METDSESVSQNENDRLAIEKEEQRAEGRKPARTKQTRSIAKQSQKQPVQLEKILKSIDKQAEVAQHLKKSIENIIQRLERIEKTNSIVSDWVTRKKAKKAKKKKKKNKMR